MKKLLLLAAAGVMCAACAACGAQKAAEETTAAEKQEITATVSESRTQAPQTEAVTEPSTEVQTETEMETETATEPAVTYTEDQLIILNDNGMYTYDELLSDNEVILGLYGEYVHQDSLGTTADGRELIHYVVGSPDAKKEIFINAGIHAREYLTSQLVMKQLVTYLAHVKAGDSYGDLSYEEMWKECQIHVVPMVNPDGISISQLGLDGILTEEVLQGIYNIAAADGTSITTYYLDRWKANATGVDLNRNFDAYWDNYKGTGHISADHYKGEYPGSEPESAALIELTNSCHFSYTISYHTQGELIYWRFADMDEIYDRAEHWVNQLSAATGYRLDGNYDVIDPAGYSDWGIYKCKIPSVTMEVSKGESPYLQDQFDKVWKENETIWELTVAEALRY